MASARPKVRVGDIFQVPIDEVRAGYGQVLATPEKNVLFICIFSGTTEPAEVPDVNEIVRSEILLAGSTFDAKFKNGDWLVIGNLTSNLNQIALPVFKSGKDETAIVESLDRSRRRPATKEEEKVLPFRTYTAPVGFELALKALAGIGPWMAAYDNLKYDAVMTGGQVQI